MTKILITGGIDENKNYLDSTEVLDLVRGPSANCNISNLTKPLAKATGGFLPNFGPIICGGSSTEITVAENECYLLSKNCMLLLYKYFYDFFISKSILIQKRIFFFFLKLLPQHYPKNYGKVDSDLKVWS